RPAGSRLQAPEGRAGADPRHDQDRQRKDGAEEKNDPRTLESGRQRSQGLEKRREPGENGQAQGTAEQRHRTPYSAEVPASETNGEKCAGRYGAPRGEGSPGHRGQQARQRDTAHRQTRTQNEEEGKTAPARTFRLRGPCLRRRLHSRASSQ